MKEKKLSREEERVYKAIVEFIQKEGYSPSLKEIALKTFIPRSTVHRIVHRLREKSYIKFKNKYKRTISLVGYSVNKNMK